MAEKEADVRKRKKEEILKAAAKKPKRLSKYQYPFTLFPFDDGERTDFIHFPLLGKASCDSRRHFIIQFTGHSLDVGRNGRLGEMTGFSTLVNR